jgi:hypothetical protein
MLQDMPSYYITGPSTRKHSQAKNDAALACIGTRTIVVERGVLWSDIMLPTYRFIFEIFEINGWLSLFYPVRVYPHLVREFYHNMRSPIVNSYSSPRFVTEVSGTQLHITSKLINEVTGIPLTSDISLPITDQSVPTNAQLMDCVHPGLVYRWKKNKNKIPICYLPDQNRLLALIVMQNIWPISCNSYVPLNHALLFYAIIKRISFCLCKHMVKTMIKVHQDYPDYTIALPFGGLITKILEAKLPNIPPTELVVFSEKCFRKLS